MNDTPLPGTSPTAELLTGIEGVSSRPVRRIVLAMDEKRPPYLPTGWSQEGG